MSPTSPLQGSRDPYKTPSPEQLQASSSKLKTQHEARSNGLVHSREVLKKRDVQSPQGYMESSYSPPSSALSLSYSASSASSLQRCSTPPPTTRTQVPCSELEGEEDDFCIANKPSIIPIPGYKSVTPSSLVRKDLGSLALDSKVNIRDKDRYLRAPPSPSHGRGLTMKRPRLPLHKNLSTVPEHQIQRVHRSDNEVSHQCTTTDAAVDEKSTEKHNSMTVHSSKVTQTSASTMLHKEDPNRSSSPLHSERSTPDPDLDSISSYGSTHSEDESDDETLSNIHEDSATRAKYWKLHLDQQSLINVSKSALSNLPPEIAGKTLTALGAVFQSWMTGIESYANPHISEVPSHSFPEVTGTQPQNNPPSYFQRTTCDERKRKSKPESDSDQSDSDQSADENKHPRKRKRNAPFACPYYADDERYCRWTPHGDFSHCAKDPGFKEVHRVKGHLFRYHLRKPHCYRCDKVFKTENELMAHSRSTQPCEIKDLQDFKPLTGQQILRLKKREHNGLGEEERWKNIYNICFPNADQIPSPYHVCYYDRVLNDVRRSLIHEITHLRRDNNTIPIFADGETASQEVAQHVDNFIRPRIFRDITRNSELNFAPQVFVNSSSRVPECHTMTSASVMDGGGLESQGFRSGTHDSTFTSTFSSDHYLQNQNQSPTLTNGNENVEWPAPVPVPSNANMLPLAAAQYFCDFPEGQTQYGLGQGADQSLVQQNISDRFGEETMDDSMPQFGFGQGGLSQCELCGRSRNGNGNGNGNRVMDDSRFQFGQLQGEPSQCSSCGGNRNATGNGTWA